MFGVKKVVIVGGGFAGLNCAKALAGKSEFSVTLIDRHDYHQFQPLLYQVAIGALSPQNAAFNLRVEFNSDENVEVVTTEIVSADLDQRSVRDAHGHEYAGDYLVLAAGNEANFFGIKGAKEYCLPIYSLSDAERLRTRFFAALENAALNPPASGEDPLSIVIVGGGPTGVEVAGAIQDLLRLTPKNAYPNLDLSAITVTLIDSGTSLLAPFTAASQDYARRMLEERGVTVRLGVAANEVTPTAVHLSDGGQVRFDLAIWAGGVKASPLSASLGVIQGSGGRIEVESDLTLLGHPGVYALGDFANVKGADGAWLPQLAAVAQQAGRYCGEAIMADAAGRESRPFTYHDKGILAMIGRNAAISELGAHHHPVNGPFAFITWLGVHAALLANLRAETETIFEWVFDYARGIPMNPLRINGD